MMWHNSLDSTHDGRGPDLLLDDASWGYKLRLFGVYGIIMIFLALRL